MNAFRAQTVHEMIQAFQDAWDDAEIGVAVLTGAGDKAFCTGGDQKSKKDGSYGFHGGEISHLHGVIRHMPKPVIAAVNGYAIGGGHVLHVVCDLSIASEKAIFGQVGPKVGSVDPGYGTAYLARVVGEKKAREIWYLCRRYNAQEALAMGLVNKVVPHDKLAEEVAGLVQGDPEYEPDGAAHRQDLVQCRLRQHLRDRRSRLCRARSVLEHGGVARRRQGVRREAAARVPEAQGRLEYVESLFSSIEIAACSRRYDSTPRHRTSLPCMGMLVTGVGRSCKFSIDAIRSHS